MDHNSDAMFLLCLHHLNSSPLAPCVSEVIINMHSEELQHHINGLMTLLQSDDCDIQDKKLIYDFIDDILLYRKDGKELVTEQLIPMAVEDMLAADTKGQDQTTAAVSRVLCSLAKVYGELVIYEILLGSDIDQISPAVLKTISDIKAHLDVLSPSLNNLLSSIKLKMNKAAGGKDNLNAKKRIDSHRILLRKPRKHQELIKDLAGEAVTLGTWKEIYGMMKTLLHSSIPYNKRTATIFMAEILPMTSGLQMDDYNVLKAEMLHLLDEEDLYIFSAALECIENLLRQHPREANKCKIEIAMTLTKKISPKNLQLNGNLIKTLLTVVQMGKWHTVLMSNRRLLKEMLLNIVPYLDSNNKETQIYAIQLFGALWEKLGTTQVVKDLLTPMLLKVNSSDQEISSSAEAALRQGLKDLRREPLPETPAERVQQLYNILQRNKLLKPSLFHCLELLCEVRDRDALFRHLRLLKDTIPFSAFTPLDLSNLWEILHQNLKGDPDTGHTAILTSRILGEKWSSLREIEARRIVRETVEERLRR